MSRKEAFFKHITDGYTCKGDYLILGGAMLDDEAITDAHIKVPLKTMNRHGLIAGATGTGKTKTLQVISEQLSEKGVPVLVMDIKGDLSGIAKPGKETPFITERHTKINLPYSVKGFPVELMSLSQQDGVRMRATVSEFGPVLFSRILDLNDTQAGILSVIFKYCDDLQIALLDLKDIKKVIQYVTGEGKEDLEREYGKISTSSTGIILRKIIELEQQDADRESAYELLSRKIEAIEKEEAQQAARKEWEMETKRSSKTPARTTSSRSRKTTISPVVKVLTSATFIRGVMGILKKTMK